MKIYTKAETLCELCSNGTVMKDDAGIRRVSCDAGMADRRITFRVVSCSRFHDKNKTRMVDYEKTAWIIVPSDGSRAQVGFLRPGTPEHKKAIGND